MYFYSIQNSFKYTTIVLYFCFFAATVLSCTNVEKPKTSITIFIESKKTGADIPINVETAVTAQEQQRGFMNRKEIPDGTGMIFISASALHCLYRFCRPHP